MTATDYPGRGELPDALAFVRPTRATFWLDLRERDHALTASALTAERQESSATVYRMLSELESHGLVASGSALRDGIPKTVYWATYPDDGPTKFDALATTEADQ